VIVKDLAVIFPRPRQVEILRSAEFHRMADDLTLLLEH